MKHKKTENDLANNLYSSPTLHASTLKHDEKGCDCDGSVLWFRTNGQTHTKTHTSVIGDLANIERVRNETAWSLKRTERHRKALRKVTIIIIIINVPAHPHRKQHHHFIYSHNYTLNSHCNFSWRHTTKDVGIVSHGDVAFASICYMSRRGAEKTNWKKSFMITRLVALAVLNNNSSSASRAGLDEDSESRDTDLFCASLKISRFLVCKRKVIL